MTWKVSKTWNISSNTYNTYSKCVVQLENNFVLLGIKGKYIQIWNINEEEPKLIFSFGDFYSLCEIWVVSNNRIVTFEKKHFAVWSINEPFSKDPVKYLDYTSEQFKGYCFNKERNILILNFKKEFAIFNIETYQKIKINDLKIKDVSKWNIDSSSISSVIPSRDKKWFFSLTQGKIIMMNIETKEINQFKLESIDSIYKLLPLDDNHFLSEDRGSIWIWKYEIVKY